MPLYVADLGITGLSDVGYQFLDSSGSGIGSRTTTGVSEMVAGKGIYGVEVAMASGAQAIYWNSSGTASAYAIGAVDARVNDLNDPSASDIRTEIDSNSTQLASILEDTGTTLPATLSTIAGYIDTEVAAIKAVTDNLPDSGALTTLAGNVSDILTDTGTTLPGTLSTITGYIDTEVAAIKAVTDKLDDTLEDDGGTYRFTENALEEAPGGNATEAKQDTIIAALAVVDGIVDDILVDTGTTLPAAIAGIATATGTGAYTITVTVTDGTSALQNAAVRVLDGSTTLAYGVTDASGNVEFSLDAGTFTVAITKANFQFTPESRTVTGDEAGTLTNDLEMTALATSPSTTSIRTASFRDVLHGVARRKGLDPNVNLQDNEAATLTEYINSAYEFIWRWYPWPESVTIEQVTFASQELARSGTTAYAIDQVFGISVNHPITSTNPTPISYKVAGSKVYVIQSEYGSSSLYVAYRRPVPQFTTTDYSASATYAVGDVIYFTDGDCYRCIEATTAGQSPTTHAAKWEKQEIIDYLKNAVLHGAMVEALGEEGQHSTSLIEDGKLQGYLEQELDRIELDQGMTRWITTSAGEYSSRR